MCGGAALEWYTRSENLPRLAMLASSGTPGDRSVDIALQLQKAGLSGSLALSDVAAQMEAQRQTSGTWPTAGSGPVPDVAELVAAVLDYPLDATLDYDLTARPLTEDDLQGVAIVLLESYDRGEMPNPKSETFASQYDQWIDQLMKTIGRQDIQLHLRVLLTGRCTGPDVALQLKALALAEEEALPGVVPLSRRLTLLRNKTVDFTRRTALLAAGALGMLGWQVKDVLTAVPKALDQRRRPWAYPPEAAKTGTLGVAARSALRTVAIGGAWLALDESSKGAIYGRPLEYTRRVADTLKAVTAGRDVRTVLEIGIGCSTTNLQHGYYSGARGVQLYGLDPAPPEGDKLMDAQAAAEKYGVELLLRRGMAEDLGEFADGFFDAVICTNTFCTVGDPKRAIEEVKRVLRPGGRFGFVEHVSVLEDEARQALPKRALQVSQRVLDPLQQALHGGCSLCRDTDSLIARTFGDGTRQRFEVPEMWPVSQFVCGVVTKA
mmetsp:Transcript_153358/g.268079  ORF Transcript_153358/g.268079 Transcript_153358/m.268079 type:complete len:492 (+) Transcript_153358:501-1976(+)